MGFALMVGQGELFLGGPEGNPSPESSRVRRMNPSTFVVIMP